jgi:hypothetical protein
MVLSWSVELSNATDGEWPATPPTEAQATAWLHDPRRVLRTWCEGLEFETATFHPAEVEAAGGRDAWVRATYGTPEMWVKSPYGGASYGWALQARPSPPSYAS